MKFSFEWLKDYVDCGLDAEAAGARLTAVGIPLDSIEQVDGDAVFDFDVGTNRPDCMNHFGLARELAVATGKELRQPPREPASPAGTTPAAKLASLEVEAPDLCGRYTALVIRGVKVGASPAWLARRLFAIGQRPINSVVDATNYVLWEMGHPLHAFDLARLSGRKVRVRRAKPGEPLTTLDGVARKLDDQMLVIADDRRAVAMAGVLGGMDSEISLATTDILLESAYFDPVSVRKTARRLGVHTDASHRFERGADPEITLRAAERCARLITEVAGGKLAPGCLESRAAAPFSRKIPLRPERIRRILDLEVGDAEIRKILEALGCSVEPRDAGLWIVSTPSFRGDLSGEVDLAEEIARHHGYDRIPATLPRVLIFPEGRPETARRIHRVREAMVRCGFTEALNLSLISDADNAFLGREAEGMKVVNPLSEGQDRLRTGLLPGLLRNLVHNLNHGAEDVRLFEVGRAFRRSAKSGELPEEEEVLALVCGGKGGVKHWSEPERRTDLFDLKGAVDLAARLLGLSCPSWEPCDLPFLRKGTGAAVKADGSPAGFAGEILPAAAASFGLEAQAYVAEVSLARFLSALPAGFVPRHTPLSRTPSVSRDLSLILDQRHTYAEVEQAVRSVEGAPIARVRIFDRYQGKPVPEGKVSMAVNIVFQTAGRTLVSGEVAESMQRIVQQLRDRLGAVLRGDCGRLHWHRRWRTWNSSRKGSVASAR